MKFNAHLLQSQKYTADIGEGGVSGAKIDSGFPMSKSTSSPISGFSGFAGEQPYRNAFIQRIFSTKRGVYNGVTTYLYDKFYELSETSVSYLVQPHELPTMGQIWDYLLRPRSGVEEDPFYFPGGIITKYVGDHFSDTDSNLTLRSLLERKTSGNIPTEKEWGRYSLVKKLYTILSNIIASEHQGIAFPIYASNFYGGNLIITNESVETITVKNFYAGTNATENDGTDIFQVRNDATKSYKYIYLLYNNIDPNDPVGIHGQFSGSDTFADLDKYYFGGTKPFSYTDVSRYYFRRAIDAYENYIDSHTYDDGGLRWAEGLSDGSIGFFYYAASKTKRLIFKEPSSSISYVLQTLPSSEQLIYNYTPSSQFNFHLLFNHDTTGLKLTRGVVSYIFSIYNTGNGQKHLALIPSGSVAGNKTIYFPLQSGNVQGDIAMFLTNQGEETFYVDDDNDFSPMFKIFKGSAAGGYYARIGLSKRINTYGIKFGFELPNSNSDRRKCWIPLLENDSEVVVTNPETEQTINNLSISNLKTDTVSPLNSEIIVDGTLKVGGSGSERPSVNYLTDGVFAIGKLSYDPTVASGSTSTIGFGCYKSSNITYITPSQFKIQVAGFYKIHSGISYSIAATGSYWAKCQLRIKKNGSVIDTKYSTFYAVVDSTIYNEISAETMEFLDKNDLVSFDFYNGASDSITLLQNGCVCTIQLVREFYIS